MSFVWDVEKDVHQLNGIGEPFLFRIGLGGLFARYGVEPVRHTLIEDAARAGAISIATAPGWMRLGPPRRKAG
jgi:hypothetical protein